MITFDELIKQHAELWPETNILQQKAKFDEEFQEFKKPLGRAAEEELYKLADMVIASAGVARFIYYSGFDLLLKTMNYLDRIEWTTPALWNAVELKMKKHRDLKWQSDPKCQKVVGTIRMSKETYDWLTTPSEEDDDIIYKGEE